MENYKLIDNVALHQYEFRIGDLIPRIEYIKTKNGEIYLTHKARASAAAWSGWRWKTSSDSSCAWCRCAPSSRDTSRSIRNGNASSWKESPSHKTPDYEKHDRVFER